MTCSYHIGLFLAYPRRCWLRFKSAALYGTLANFHPTNFASELASARTQTTSGDNLPMLNLIYTFATGCLLLILYPVRCSGNRACLIQEQSANVSVDSDGWLLLRVASWIFHYHDPFLRTFVQRCSCCFALIQKTSVLVFHFWFDNEQQIFTD